MKTNFCKKLLLILLISLPPKGARAVENPNFPKTETKRVIFVGTIESFDLDRVTLVYKGAKLAVPKSVFKKNLDFRPGQTMTLFLPLEQLESYVVFPRRRGVVR